MALENNQIENSNIDNDEISLKDVVMKIKALFAFIISKWKILFIVIIIGGSIGFKIAISSKPTYKAVLTFAMDDDRGGGGIGGAAGLASSLGLDIGGGAASGGAFAATNLSELMKSHLLVEKVLLEPILLNDKIISLAEYYIQINELRESWNNKPALKNIQFLPSADRSNFTLQQDSILKQIHNSLIDKEKLSIMQKDKKVTILSIEVTSENELFSKIFCESLAKKTSDFYIETKSKKARINVDVLQKQVDSVRNALNGAITGVANEADNVYNLNPAFNVKGAPSKKRQIDVQANTAIMTNLAVQLELAKISLRKETPLIQLIDRPILPLEKKKLSKLKAIFLGGFLAGFFAILYLIFSQFFKKMLS
jgi:hypothetical protein